MSNLFSGKNKNNILICLLLEILPRVLSIKLSCQPNIFQVYTYDNYYRTLTVVGYATLNIFVETGTERQPVVDKPMQVHKSIVKIIKPLEYFLSPI